MISAPCWPLVKLESVCDFLDSKRVPVNETERRRRIAGKHASELYPYYGANGQVGLIDGFIFSEPLILLAEDGGFFGSEDRPIAYAVNGKFWVNNHAHILRPKREIIDFDFCLHAIRVRPDIGALVAGSTRPKLTRESAGKISLILPPLHRQKRIASLLTEQFAELERSRKAVAAQLQAANSLSTAFLRTEFNRSVTAKWPRRYLAEILMKPLRTGLSKPTTVSSDVRCLTLSSVRNGKLDLSASKPVDVTEREISQNQIRPGAFYVVRGNGNLSLVARGALAPAEVQAPVIYPDLLIEIVPDPGVMLAPFLRWAWDAPDTREALEKKSMTSAGIYKINLTNLSGIELPVPPLADQQIIASRIDAEFEKTQSLREHLTETLAAVEKLPATLLREAFSGRM